jgi:hypothetical protein
MNLLYSVHELTYFMGFPSSMIWFPILIGIIVGALIPLKSIARKRIHFTILPHDEVNSERDVDALNKLLPKQKQENVKLFCFTLRKLGLTLRVEK